MDIRALVRIEQARLVVEDAHADVSGWLKALAAADPRGHHASHRAILGRLADQTRALLSAELPAPTAPALDQACRQIERRAAAVRRLGDRFRALLTQRLDPTRRAAAGGGGRAGLQRRGVAAQGLPVTFLDARAAPTPRRWCASPTARIPSWRRCWRA
ncbi:MAG: hypothetical protein R3F60_11985 [bacterium]